MKPLCIYHGNCADGFGAAWVVWKFFKGEVDFHPGVYQNPPPDVSGRIVLVVDFAYKREVMLELARKNFMTVVLDHHATASENLQADESERVYRAPDPRRVKWANIDQDLVDGDLFTVFDMERSGAGLTWDFFNPRVPRPKLIDHIEDRDLWRFKYEDTRAIQANLFSYPYDFELWNQFMECGENPKWLNQFAIQGLAIERKHHKDIAELVEVVTRPMRFRLPNLADYPNEDRYAVVPAANLPYTMTSDAGHLLCGRSFEGREPIPQPDDIYLNSVHPFAACYWDTPEGRVFSLRSLDDGADVGEIAKQYGGGGHKHAAGFRVPYDRLSEFEP